MWIQVLRRRRNFEVRTNMLKKVPSRVLHAALSTSLQCCVQDTGTRTLALNRFYVERLNVLFKMYTCISKTERYVPSYMLKLKQS